jgi:transposase
MKIMHTMASDALANRPQRRFYSPELKAQVMQECRQGGASVAGVALSHGINANIVHRWLREHTRSALVVQSPAFVPVTLDESAPVSTPTPQAEPDIRVGTATPKVSPTWRSKALGTAVNRSKGRPAALKKRSRTAALARRSARNRSVRAATSSRDNRKYC